MSCRLRIGLTGGIASGKSTVARRFVELGIPVIDADAAARAVVAPGTAGLAGVTHRFGGGVLTPGGELDRRALRGRVFADADARRDLEALLHPLIRAEMDLLAAAAHGPYVVLEIPLLVEAGTHAEVDRILVVDVEESVQLARLMERDAASRDAARAILAAQAHRDERLAQADDVLDNTGSILQLRQCVDRLHERYLRLATVPPARAGGHRSDDGPPRGA